MRPVHMYYKSTLNCVGDGKDLHAYTNTHTYDALVSVSHIRFVLYPPERQRRSVADQIPSEMHLDLTVVLCEIFARHKKG